MPIEQKKMDRSGLIGCQEGLVAEVALKYLVSPEADKFVEDCFSEYLPEGD